MNVFRGESVLQAGGETYQLVFDANAFCHAESVLAPLTTEEILALVTSGLPKTTLLRGLVWAGLQRKHEGIHLYHAGDIMTEVGLQAVWNAIGEALSAAFGVKEGGEEENPPTSQNGTGSTSTPSGVKQGSTSKPSGGKPRA